MSFASGSMAKRPSKVKASDCYQTPPEVLDAVRARLGVNGFSLDVAADADTSAGARHFGRDSESVAAMILRYKTGHPSPFSPRPFVDGLHADWTGEVDRAGWAWCNPPYSGNHIGLWLRKAIDENHVHGCNVAVLLPHARSTQWWHRLVAPYASEVHTFSRRIAFLRDGKPVKGNTHESMLVVFRAGQRPGRVIDFPRPIIV